MAADLPAGAKIPVTFSPGDNLTADTLNQLQTDLLTRILTHTHAGNRAADQQGPQIGSGGIADAAIKANHMSAGAVDAIALQYHSVERDRLAWPVIEELNRLGTGIAEESQRIDALDEHFHNDRKIIVHLEEQVAHQEQHIREIEGQLWHQSQRSEILEERLLNQAHRSDQLQLLLAQQAERIDQLEQALGRQSHLLERTAGQVSELTSEYDTVLADVAGLAHRTRELEQSARPTTWGYFRVRDLLVADENEFAHNVREVEVIVDRDVEILELRFRTPYRSDDYTCVVTPEAHALPVACSLAPVIMGRSRYAVRIAFWDGGEWRARDLSWNVVIFGELARHD